MTLEKRGEAGGLNLCCPSGSSSSTRLVSDRFFLSKVGDRWKLYGGIAANYISGSTKECSIGKEADDTHRGEGQFKMTL